MVRTKRDNTNTLVYWVYSKNFRAYICIGPVWSIKYKVLMYKAKLGYKLNMHMLYISFYHQGQSYWALHRDISLISDPKKGYESFSFWSMKQKYF